MKRVKDAEDETIKQLDVVLLMRRIFYLEKCVGMLLPETQKQCYYGQEKPTLEEAEERRKKYQLSYQL